MTPRQQLYELVQRLRRRTVPNWVPNTHNAMTHMDGHKPDPDCGLAASALEQLARDADTWEERARARGYRDPLPPYVHRPRESGNKPEGFPFDITPQ
jgi:hypothetical protein